MALALGFHLKVGNFGGVDATVEKCNIVMVFEDDCIVLPSLVGLEYQCKPV